MRTSLFTGILVGLLAGSTVARDVPANVRAFYNRIKNGKCTGGNVLKEPFYSQYPGSKTYAYCQDKKGGVVYIHGTGSNFANMDIDCDGDQSDHGDGRCGNSDDTQSITAFQYLVEQYSTDNGAPVSDLNANFIPYVVFGNSGSKAGYTNFRPQRFGIKPLSVMAVVCGDKLVYGVWGDTNGDDGKPLVGEASIALATECFGTGITGDNGHDENDVLYIAFPGNAANTVNKKAAWGAKDFATFEASIAALGDQLVERYVIA